MCGVCVVHGMKQRRRVGDRKNEREEFCVKLVWSCRDNRGRLRGTIFLGKQGGQR